MYFIPRIICMACSNKLQCTLYLAIFVWLVHIICNVLYTSHNFMACSYNFQCTLFIPRNIFMACSYNLQCTLYLAIFVWLVHMICNVLYTSHNFMACSYNLQCTSYFAIFLWLVHIIFNVLYLPLDVFRPWCQLELH